MLNSGAVCFGFAFIHIYLNLHLDWDCMYFLNYSSLVEIPASSKYMLCVALG